MLTGINPRGFVFLGVQIIDYASFFILKLVPQLNTVRKNALCITVKEVNVIQTDNKLILATPKNIFSNLILSFDFL
ncbi:hypothetical protein Dtox_0548 [Desulfofarcimen acetoxidans DSM 771]|uniref:Uncharacterized protein n=1 Tax=Desulfofarcimen acetoxidans (strain ATCC 49208 / DSM 771 / KCTC 5769 / VKM B-1644 / 5575) TaxID=485916 RepID=C8W613_DESAS|nr:hypothetical protein Dtox_0548 [Desulfofarcimen acetoxidans DSM 771]